jgi:hypothetical protein
LGGEKKAARLTIGNEIRLFFSKEEKNNKKKKQMDRQAVHIKQIKGQRRKKKD